jgi:transcriptional regulator with XRE-family HTH domain
MMGVSRSDERGWDWMKTLREWRAERLESSKTLATRAGVSNKTILEIENGRQVPTFRTIRRLSEALGVDPAEVAEFAAAIEERGKDAA